MTWRDGVAASVGKSVPACAGAGRGPYMTQEQLTLVFILLCVHSLLDCLGLDPFVYRKYLQFALPFLALPCLALPCLALPCLV